jgi:hypothetical protein
VSDDVNTPAHYTVVPGVECIDVTENFSFLRGNAIKYCWRHQHKGNPRRDLEKAIWYIDRELAGVERERWAEWPTDTRYEVSTFGNVRNASTGSLRKAVQIKNGYMTIGRTVSGKNKLTYVHRMVIETFEGPIPRGRVVCHNNGDRTDNHLHNLRTDTMAGNLFDRRRHGTDTGGVRNVGSALTMEQVEQIRALPGTETLLAEQFGVNRATIGRIRRGQSYLADPRPELDRRIDLAADAIEGNVGIAIWFLGTADYLGQLALHLSKAKHYIKRELDGLPE